MQNNENTPNDSNSQINNIEALNRVFKANELVCTVLAKDLAHFYSIGVVAHLWTVAEGLAKQEHAYTVLSYLLMNNKIALVRPLPREDNATQP